MSDEGWVKLHRKLLESLAWEASNSKQRNILITLLLMANHKPKDWIWEGKRFSVGPGQFVTSLDSIKSKCSNDISVQNIRTALVHFETIGFLTNKSTKTGRLITIVNWALYQCGDEDVNKEANKELTKSLQRPNKDLTTNKNVKNVKNERNNSSTTKKSFNPPSLEEVKAYAKERGRPELAQKFYDYYNAPEDPKDKWRKGNGKPVLAWKQQFITWEGYNQTPAATSYRPDKPEPTPASFRPMEAVTSDNAIPAPPDVKEKLNKFLGRSE